MSNLRFNAWYLYKDFIIHGHINKVKRNMLHYKENASGEPNLNMEHH